MLVVRNIAILFILADRSTAVTVSGATESFFGRGRNPRKGHFVYILSCTPFCCCCNSIEHFLMKILLQQFQMETFTPFRRNFTLRCAFHLLPRFRRHLTLADWTIKKLDHAGTVVVEKLLRFQKYIYIIWACISKTSQTLTWLLQGLGEEWPIKRIMLRKVIVPMFKV